MKTNLRKNLELSKHIADFSKMEDSKIENKLKFGT